MKMEAKTKEQLIKELENTRRQNELLVALNECTIPLVEHPPSDLEEGLIILVMLAGRLLKVPHGFVSFIEPFAEKPKFKGGQGRFSQKTDEVENLVKQVWENRKSVIVDNLIAVPIKAHDQLIGVIGLGYSVEASQTFDKAELEVLEKFADFASKVLHQTVYLSATQKRAAQLAIFYSIQAEISSVVLNLDTMKILCEQMTQTFSANCGSIALLNSTHTALTVITEFNINKGQRSVGNTLGLADNPLFEEVIKNGVVTGYYPDKSHMVIPLRVKSETIGIISLKAEPERTFTGEEMEFATRITDALLDKADTTQLSEIVTQVKK